MSHWIIWCQVVYHLGTHLLAKKWKRLWGTWALQEKGLLKGLI